MDKNEWVTGKIGLRIGDQTLEMEMTVPANPIKPHRMLPIFQQMASSIVDISVKATEETGAKISCKAGCGACCRQPVPLAEIEVYQIAELVESMPEPRRSVIKKRFADGYSRLNEMKWFERIGELANREEPANADYVPSELIEEAMRYFHAGIPCPFLEDESCSIHPSRPLACREYLVTSPAANCSNPSAQTIKKVPLLMHPSRSLRFVGQTGKLEHFGIIPLIRALEWAEQYPESFVEKKGEQWAADFFQQLTGSEIPKKNAEPQNPVQPAKRPRKRKK
jgi:Fe-S-cluster containining protein